MSRYLIIASALVAGAWTGGPLAAQQIRLPEGAHPAPQTAPAQPSNQAGRPARPTNLHARALSTDEALLFWSDNAVNEHEYRVEVRWHDRAWEDIGAIAPNVTSIYIFALEPATTYYFRIRAKNGAGHSAYSNETAVTSFVPPEALAPCQPGPDVLCLRDGRYRAEATYEAAPGVVERARVNKVSDEAGFFWFFTPGNIEVLIKMIDGCALNERRWVFTTGLTNLRVLILVTDAQTGATSTYLAEANRPFQPIQDADAFASCE